MKRRERGEGPTRRFGRKVLPAVAVLLTGAVCTLGLVGYRLTHPPLTPEAVLPAHYLLEGREVSWGSRDGLEISGLWIPGRIGAPAVVLAPGHGMSRSDALSLAAELHRKGFNLLVFAQRGSGSVRRGAAWLGAREPDDLAAAFDFVDEQPGMDGKPMGVWGVDVGAFSALRASVAHPEVVAIAADSPFPGVRDFVRIRLREDLGLGPGRLSEFLSGLFASDFVLMRGSGSAPLDLLALAGRSVLLIRGGNRPWASPYMDELAEGIGPGAKVAVLPAARERLLSGNNLVEYDRRVTAFFQSSLNGRRDTGPSGR